MSQQYIFAMEGVTRLYEQKEVLSNIWLSFYPGAKIGVLGNNGSGKSTLLRTMIGLQAPAQGDILYDGQSFWGLDEEARRVQVQVVVLRLPKKENVQSC